MADANNVSSNSVIIILQRKLSEAINQNVALEAQLLDARYEIAGLKVKVATLEQPELPVNED